MAKGINNIEHIYSSEELQRFICKYNSMLNLLKVSGKFDLDDKIVNIERGFTTNQTDGIYRDYLDFLHKSVAENLGDLGNFKDALHCIKFTLKSGKTFILSEEKTENLPAGIHSLNEFEKDLSNITGKSRYSYRTAIELIISEISRREYEYFSSHTYKKLRQQLGERIIDALKEDIQKNIDNG